MNEYSSVSSATKSMIDHFFAKMTKGHLQHDLGLMSELYHPSVVAIETNTTFMGKEKVLDGLRLLFSFVEFTKWTGKVVAASECESVVWVYAEYLTAWKDRKSGKAMELKDARCTYVLQKEESGLVILQNHVSMPMVLG